MLSGNTMQLEFSVGLKVLVTLSIDIDLDN